MLASGPAPQFRAARSPTGMGALSEEDLFISPMMSFVVIIVVMILMQLGSNYFNRQWSGERRLRNLVIAMEWLPRQCTEHEVAVLLATALSLTQQRDLDDLDWAREFDAALSVPILTAYPPPTAVSPLALPAAHAARRPRSRPAPCF